MPRPPHVRPLTPPRESDSLAELLVGAAGLVILFLVLFVLLPLAVAP